MANEQNLISFATRSPRERKEIAIRGAKKSHENRKRRETLKETLLLLLATNNAQQHITTALLEKAMSGDVKAFETIRDTIGEKQKEVVQQEIKAEVKASVNVDLSDRIANLMDSAKKNK